MATIKYRLSNNKRKDNTYNIQLEVQHKQKQARISTKYYVPKGLYKDGKITRRCDSVENVKSVNDSLEYSLVMAREAIRDLTHDGSIYDMTVVEIRDYIKHGGKARKKKPYFLAYFKEHKKSYSNTSTKNKYSNTYVALEEFFKHDLLFEEINKTTLYRFKAWRLKKCMPNTVNMDLRNIKTVFNRAIDDNVIDQGIFPFRKFEFCTAEKRHYLKLSLDEIKEIRDLNSEQEGVNDARDFFMLSFYLIGINNVDIYNITDIKEDRIIYTRQKTGKLYSVKVEPEALEIIERHRGKTTFLDWSERFTNSNTLTNVINRRLKLIKPDLIMYAARHSWVGIAESEPIFAGQYLISQALGHGAIGGATGYYHTAQSKPVDDLNRSVIDQLIDQVIESTDIQESTDTQESSETQS